MNPIAKAKADEFYTLANGYEFHGTKVLVLKQDGGKYLVQYGNGRQQWLPALNVRIKKIRVEGRWQKAC